VIQGYPAIAGGSLAHLTDDELRARMRDWPTENLTSRIARLRGAGGPRREYEAFGIIASRALGLPREPARGQDRA